MNANILIFLLLAANNLFCQNQIKYDKRIVDNYSEIGILEAPFMIDELIEIYKKDSLVVKNVFNSSIYKRTEYTQYCYNVCAGFFYTKLIENRNNENKLVVDKIISELDYEKYIIKPEINWSNVFRTCLTCPFGEYPDDRFFYFQYSILLMEEFEIKEMIKYNNGEQWKYAIMAIKGGDAFTLDKSESYSQYVLDRRKANYIIEKWKDSDIKEVQELIAVYKSVM